MSLWVSIPKTGEQIPLDNLLTLTRTALGLGIGMLVPASAIITMFLGSVIDVLWGKIDRIALNVASTGPLPEAAFHSDVKGGLTAARNVRNWARTEGLTIRQLYERFAGARGQRTLKGTPSQIADDMQTWFENRAVDGFLIQPSHLPGGLNEFVDLVIPELQSRGLFRSEYDGPTLRDNLELPRPVSRYTTVT